MIDIEKAAFEFATTNANEWYSAEEIKSDGGYRWSVHRDGAEEGYKSGFAAATAEAKEREALWRELLDLEIHMAERNALGYIINQEKWDRLMELRSELFPAAQGEKENG